MTELLLPAAIGAAVGHALGAVFYGGLWATVRGAVGRGHPLALLAASFTARAALAGVVLTLLARQGLAPLLSGLLGFLASRPLLTRALAGRSVGTGGGPRQAGGAASADERAAREEGP